MRIGLEDLFIGPIEKKNVFPVTKTCDKKSEFKNHSVNEGLTQTASAVQEQMPYYTKV